MPVEANAKMWSALQMLFDSGHYGGHPRRWQMAAHVRQHLGERALYTNIHEGASALSGSILLHSPSSGMPSQPPPGAADARQIVLRLAAY
jgi:hypothetical protein